MLQKLHSLNPCTTKTTPAPIAQPTIREKVSIAIQERFTAIRASLACLCCVKPIQKKVVVQKPSTGQVVQAALKNVAQFAKTHKKALIGIATVGAVGAAAYNWNAIDLLRSSPDNIPAQRLPILTYTQIFSGIGVLAIIGVGSRFCTKKQPVESLPTESKRIRLKDKLADKIETFNKQPISKRVDTLAVLDRDERLAMLHMIDPQGKNHQLRNMLTVKLQKQ